MTEGAARPIRAAAPGIAWPPTILDRYMVAELVGPFSFGLSAFTLIFAATQILAISRLVSDRHAPLGVVIEYFLWQLPSIVVLVIPMAMLLGVLLAHVAPSLGTNGWQMLVWGFFISTVAVYHGTYTINSLSHVFGRQRYKTGDASRNNPWLAIITLGEGWHNNHHHYPASVRQGFYWWEFDVTFYMLKLMSFAGVIWDLKPVPAAVREAVGKRF